MDVGFYLGELLSQRGEVKVPRLGNFSQIRMSAYYNETEGVFYPPYSKVHFEPQIDNEDNELAEYLVTKKGISLASAKYFVEKYVANLRQQSVIADVPLGNVGVFYTERAELTFKPNEKLDNSLEVYSYPSIKISRSGAATTVEPEPVAVQEEYYPLKPITKPVTETPATESEPVAEPEPELEDTSFTPSYDEGFLNLPDEEEEERRGPLRAILITLVILGLVAGGLFALYRYEPATFAQLQFWKNNEPKAPVKVRPSTIIVPELDSINTDTAKTALNDTTAKVADTTVLKRFDLISGKGFKNLWGANEALKKYRALGLREAKLLETLPGPLIKVSIASFNTIEESESARLKLIEEGKLTKGAYIVEAPKE